MNTEFLKIKKLSGLAKLPTKGSPHSAGFDLYSAAEYTIPAHKWLACSTDIAIELPNNCYGRIAPRSGLAQNWGITVGAGVIDRDYTGNISVVLFNHSDIPFRVVYGMRIAQLICERICEPQILEVDSLLPTERGQSGFGSTGTE